MANIFFDGFETGSLVSGNPPSFSAAGTIAAVTSPVHGGAYSCKATSTATPSTIANIIGFGASSVWTRTWIQAHVTANPTSQIESLTIDHRTASASITGIYMRVATNGALSLHCRNNTSGTFGSNLIAISADTWYMVEVKTVVNASTGIIEWRLNGVIQETMTSQNTGSTNIDKIQLGADQQGDGTASIFAVFDDIMVSNSAYPGNGICITRQGTTGTPTYDAWTKTGAVTADLCWSDSPFSTGTNCNSSTSSAAQTMLTALFSSTQGGHGSEIIAAADTINACKVCFIGKVASGSTQSIRRRIGGSNTDTSKTLTTSDAYYEAPIFTDTLANINASEIGCVKDANATLTTIEDVWFMIDYTASTVTNWGKLLGQEFNRLVVP